nr:hypothetical protein BaRGS_022015 [Batillaria attramentaria]
MLYKRDDQQQEKIKAKRTAEVAASEFEAFIELGKRCGLEGEKLLQFAEKKENERREREERARERDRQRAEKEAAMEKKRQEREAALERERQTYELRKAEMEAAEAEKNSDGMSSN